MKRIKNFLIIYGLLIFLSSCATANNLVGHADRIYRFCSPEEVENNAAKVCYRACEKYRWYDKNHCKKWNLIILDLNNKDDYNSFLNADFVIIKRQSI